MVSGKIKNAVWYGLKIKVSPVDSFLYGFVSQNIEDVRELKAKLLPDDLSEVHFDDIVRDFILGKAYELIEINGL